MKLLITTQAIDKNDPILGFFHRWVEEFAKHFEQVHVICLKKGEYSLPANVTVYSLGKEEGESNNKYVRRFVSILRELRGKYDAVFSHMNPHYIVMAGWYWKMIGTPMFFWRNHARMNIMTRIAALFAKKVFFTSPYACTARYTHAVQMPVGIDTRVFAPAGDVRSGEVVKVLSLGRLSPVKKIDMLVEAAKLLPYEIHIYGSAPMNDREYEASLRAHAGKNVTFHSPVRNTEATDVYRAHDLFVNLTPNGSMDKTVLEAAACGTDVIVVNDSFRSVLGGAALLADATPQTLADKINERLSLTPKEREEECSKRREKVIASHSLERLGEMLKTHIYGSN